MYSLANFQINEAVAGSGCRDMPKYVGEGVAIYCLWSGGPNEYLNRSFYTTYCDFM